MYHSRNETNIDYRRHRRKTHQVEHAYLRRIIAETICNIYTIEPDLLEGASRGTARVALARQVAMYLAHVVGELDYSSVGRLFGRDRTTVKHACALIEDRRDDPMFDRTVDLLEKIVERLWGVAHVREEATH